MGRLRVLPYKMGSMSSKAIASYLGCKGLYTDNRSKFVGKVGDKIINWGNSSGISNDRGVIYINKPSAVKLASNKLATFRTLEGVVSIPQYYTTTPPMDDKLYVARTTLYGHSGAGIVVGHSDFLPIAPLYTEYIKKVAEYRVIVVGGRDIDTKKKLKKREYDGKRDKYVWNHSNGYVFARGGFVLHPDVPAIAIQAVATLGLDFGAVDIIEDREGNFYVLEVNTAFGIEGQTLQLVGDALQELL